MNRISKALKSFPLPHPHAAAHMNRKGVTLVELMIGMTIISIVLLSFINTFSLIQKGIQSTKGASLATNLAQEKIESLKNLSYYRLLITTASSTETRVSPNFTYDIGYYPKETIQVGGVLFDRLIYVSRVDKSTGSDNLIELSGTYPDTGLKLIRTSVIWREGTAWKSMNLRNLRENPSRTQLNASIEGTVKKTDGFTPIGGAVVEVIENPTWYNQSDSDGNYSMSMASGNYTLRVYRSGYFTKYESVTVTANSTLTKEIQLQSMGTGSASGTAYKRDRLLLSEICPVVNTDDTLEYVELYNPTTWTWTISSSTVKLKYANDVNAVSDFPSLTYAASSLPPNRFFLVASQPSVNGVNADAYYTAVSNKMPEEKNGGVALADGYDVKLDSVAWGRGGNEPPASAREGAGVTLEGGPGHGGLVNNECIERLAYSSSTKVAMDSGGSHVSLGNAFDSNANESDWVHHNHNHATEAAPAPEQNSSNAETPQTGTPAAGAYVYTDDTLSSTVLASATGYFSLTSIATGTWNISISSGGLFTSSAAVSIADGANVNIGAVTLSSTTLNGYIRGTVSAGAWPIGFYASETVQVSATGARTNSSPANTSPNYYLAAAPNPGLVIGANTSNANPKFTSGSATVSLSTNQVLTSDIGLSLGGQMWGRVMIGSSYLPGVVISAKLGGLEKGFALSGADGIWRIMNLSTSSYTVEPVLESGETASPASQIIDIVTLGDNIQASTITVSNAFRTLTGQVKYGSSAITTGVMVIASTSAIAGDPPTFSTATLTGTDVYYSASSLTDGTYNISLRGGYTYNVYAWYTAFSGDTPVTTKKNSAVVVYSTASTTTQDFTWP